MGVIQPFSHNSTCLESSSLPIVVWIFVSYKTLAVFIFKNQRRNVFSIRTRSNTLACKRITFELIHQVSQFALQKFPPNPNPFFVIFPSCYISSNHFPGEDHL